MNQATIKLIFSLVLLYPVSRLLYKYVFHVFIPFMLNQQFTLDKHVERPRLLFYIVIGGITYGCWLALQYFQYSGKYYLDVVFQALILLLLGLCSLLLHFTWTKRFTSKLIPIAKDISLKINRTSLRSIIHDDEAIVKLQTTLKNYLSCDLKSLSHFIRLTPLGKTARICWIDIGGKNNTEANLQSLLAFIIAIFPDLKKENKVQRKKVKEIAEKYFCDQSGKPIELNPTTFDLYKRTENNKPKMKIRELIKLSCKE
ncbi:MAG: hypothetical protein N4A74_18185 [Carboxylicivirga sp.]|nr:hypothetical protein [Carboxylicivirga sp.]